MENIISKLDGYFENGFIQFLIALAVVLAAAFIFSRLLKRWSRRVEGQTFRPFLYTLLKGLIVLLVILFLMLQITPLKNITVSLLAGTSVVALALSLASQDSISNLVAGFFIVTTRPFEVGDYIKIGEMQGTVTEINVRHTVLATWENSRVLIPNSMVNRMEVVNFTRDDLPYCSFLKITVSYDSDADLAIDIGRRIISGEPGVLDRRTAEQKRDGVPLGGGRVTSLGETGVGLSFTVWTRDYNASFAVMSEIRRKLAHEFRAAGIRAGHVRYGEADK